MPINSTALLRLLQLTSPALPVGAFSYSEGLEALVEKGKITDQETLKHWLIQELTYGGIRIEAAVMKRVYEAVQSQNYESLKYWNNWLSAFRDTEEIRQQSWQMGRSLLKLLEQIPLENLQLSHWIQTCGQPCNFAIAFGLTAALWEIPISEAMTGYLHSWASNLISAGVRLIPLGQTLGQQLLFQLEPTLQAAATEIQMLPDDRLETCGWGLSLASMAHETQYSRLFRS